MKFNLQGFENILAREDLRQIKIGTINYSLPFFLLEKKQVCYFEGTLVFAG